jgi:hypothetical protein
MCGVNIFIKRIANDTPSGYAPNNRINMVKRPQPIPKTILPLNVRGEEE